jgi:enhancer of mRNA-decapping protein 3
MERADSSRTVTSRDDRSVKEAYNRPVEALVEPFLQTHIAEVEADSISIPEVVVVEELEAEAEVSPEQPTVKPATAKRTRRKRTHRGNPALSSTMGTDPPVVKTKETSRSKGWRQTPLLEPNPSFQPFSTLKKKGRRGGREDQNGWGTEDATDVQELGDFDFADNLAKFDKRSVFTQLLAEDATADEDRLVSHNRISKAKPGTAGGKNLAYNENVLESPNGAPQAQNDWNSEASDLDARYSQRDTGSGRVSRRAESKLPANRRAASRQGSSGAMPQAPARSLSVNINIFHIFICYIIALAYMSQIPAPVQKPSFYLVPSNLLCEPVSPLQMLNLETIADNDLGLSEDMMSENAGRGIAEVALSALNPGGAGLIQKKRGMRVLKSQNLHSFKLSRVIHSEILSRAA